MSPPSHCEGHLGTPHHSAGPAGPALGSAPVQPQHPPKIPRIQWVMDEHGERVVVVFPCERCGDAQHYNVLQKASACFRCDGIAPHRNDSTAA